MIKTSIRNAVTAVASPWPPQVEFALYHLKNGLIVLVMLMLADLAGVRVGFAAPLLCWLALTAIQVWADLHDFEPITFGAYQALKNWSGWDPRQVDRLIERRIAPVCDALNQLPDSETLYSCQGHLRPYFSGVIPEFQRTGPYVMFRSENPSQMQQFSNFLHSDDLNNCWLLTGSFRPFFDNDQDPGGDFVWTLRCQTSFGEIWQQRRRIDQDIATITLFLRQMTTVPVEPITPQPFFYKTEMK
ncbi:MAG: hypothetical protein RIB30_09850 [Thalassospira sp.]|uniref:hypothetical protein n=1 Tax=Thalassospira sp. TaxID=1912094 RepID=UPI0032EF29E9